MKKIGLVWFMLISICFAQGNQKPNYEEIGKLIASEGENNYQNLLSRLVNNDTTLQDDQYYVLYYGHALQKNYSIMPDNMKLMDLLKNKKYTEFQVQAKAHLREFPFDLRIRDYLIQSLHQEQDGEALLYQHALHGFVDAILQSGNGRSKENAYHVLTVPDEYIILNILTFEMKRRWTEKPYDIFEFGENKYGLKHMYFDLSPYFDQLSVLFKK